MGKISFGRRAFNIVNYSFLTVLGIVFLFPYLHILSKAINDSMDTAKGGISFFPRVPTLQNIIIILSDQSFGHALMISVSRVVLGTLLALVVQFSAAYVLSKRDLIGKKMIVVYFIIPMFFSGGIIPLYMLFSKLHLLNNFLLYVLPGTFSFYNMIVMRTYIYAIPESLLESARIDGARESFILVRIILPLSMPIIATIGLWSAVGHWNDWITTLYYITNKKLYTIQYLLMMVIRESEKVQAMIQAALEQGKDVDTIKVITTPDALRCAQIIVTTLPIVMIYPFLQKYFIKGVMIGAVKE